MRDSNGNLLDDSNYFLSCVRPKSPADWGNILTTLKMKTIPPTDGFVQLNFHHFCGEFVKLQKGLQIKEEKY